MIGFKFFSLLVGISAIQVVDKRCHAECTGLAFDPGSLDPYFQDGSCSYCGVGGFCCKSEFAKSDSSSGSSLVTQSCTAQDLITGMQDDSNWKNFFEDYPLGTDFCVTRDVETTAASTTPVSTEPPAATEPPTEPPAASTEPPAASTEAPTEPPVCPGAENICWSYNSVSKECELNTHTCGQTLQCTKTQMIIKFDKNLFGTEDETTAAHFTNGGACMAVDGPSRTNGGFTWTADIGACDMVIATEGAFITMKKTFTSGDVDAGIPLGGTQIYTSGGASTSVVFTCKYASSATASSVAYDVQGAAGATGSVTDETGDFTDGLSIKYYTNNEYDVERTDPTDIGATLYPMVSWEVTTTAIGFFIQSCDVIDESNSSTKIKIIDGSCYAEVVSAAIAGGRTNVFVHQFAKFSYQSFSFNTEASDKQKISCSIQFCTMQKTGANTGTPTCDSSNSAYTGAKPETVEANCPTTTGYTYKFEYTISR